MARGDDPVVRVEEDWELKVKLPDGDIDAPQVITAWSPLANMDGLHATFEINHISSVDFSSGGLHLSLWRGDVHLSVIHAGNYAAMYEDGETVRWTQSVAVGDGLLSVEITDGSSDTWGNFGGNDSLRLSMATDLTDLDSYTLATSLDNSEVSYAGNRVQSLLVKKVRYIHASGDITTDTNMHIVHQLND
jgi:hypothetical protein